ncbi:Hypp1096 [Branchiostoma lanceolatum]|uniref:Hypp1096 protein n=1 Tax=Branchiostoma lanceolatum TaxID=7740 RepID=A0A8K0EJA0_BRALA|nr:Hypp1096 [Branchiostoma lanceolatum]
MVDGFGACRAKHMVSLGTGVLVPHVVAAVRRRYAIESTPLSVSDQHASPVMCSVHHQAFLHVLRYKISHKFDGHEVQYVLQRDNTKINRNNAVLKT